MQNEALLVGVLDLELDPRTVSNRRHQTTLTRNTCTHCHGVARSDVSQLQVVVAGWRRASDVMRVEVGE